MHRVQPCGTETRPRPVADDYEARSDATSDGDRSSRVIDPDDARTRYADNCRRLSGRRSSTHGCALPNHDQHPHQPRQPVRRPRPPQRHLARGCTTIDSDDAGRVVIVRNWPRLSSGEELLWRVLGWLQGADDLPSDDDLRAGLDGPSQVAVARATNGRRCGSGVTA